MGPSRGSSASVRTSSWNAPDDVVESTENLRFAAPKGLLPVFLLFSVVCSISFPHPISSHLFPGRFIIFIHCPVLPIAFPLLFISLSFYFHSTMCYQVKCSNCKKVRGWVQSLTRGWCDDDECGRCRHGSSKGSLGSMRCIPTSFCLDPSYPRLCQP
jgi:hypothetical protein